MNENPFVKPVKSVSLVQPKRDEDGGEVVVLERIEPGVVPDYCVHGKASCYWCGEWCWLGSNTYEIVASGDAAPICMPCATRLIPKESVKSPIRNLRDHRRKDGPH